MSWELGGGIGEGPATVTDAYWGIVPDYNEETILLCLEIEPDDGEKPEKPFYYNAARTVDRSGNPFWEIKKGDNTKLVNLRVDDLSKVKIGGQSGYGHVLAWAMGTDPRNYPGKGENAHGLAKEIQAEGGDPTDAKIWIGRRFEFAQGPSNLTARTKEDLEKGFRMWPVEYLGRAQSKKGSHKPASSTSAVSNGQVDVAALKKELRKMALTDFEDNADGFRDAALRKAEGTSLEESIIDGSFYASVVG